MAASLPPELWLDIFSLAVHVPGLFDTKWDRQPDDQIWEGRWTTVMMTSDSLKVRRAIVRVSREWWNLGRHFVFENLGINKRTEAVALAKLFEQTADSDLRLGDAAHAGLGYGRWVRRVTLQSPIWLEVGVLSDVDRLLRHCVNLQIFLLDTSTIVPPSPPPIHQLFQSQFARTLRRISFSAFPSEGQISGIFDHPTTPFNLNWVTLSPHLLHKMFPNPNVSLTPASLSNLSVLEIAMQFNDTHVGHLPTWVLPALRYLSIHNLYDHTIPSLLPFMAVNGGRLLGLSLITSKLCSNLHQLLDHTPNLQSVVLNESDLAALRAPDSTTYHSITHIGLAIIDYQHASDVHDIHQGLTQVARNLFPNLRIVRILATYIPTTLDTIWEKPITFAAMHGIRLEDRNRQLLRDRLG